MCDRVRRACVRLVVLPLTVLLLSGTGCGSGPTGTGQDFRVLWTYAAGSYGSIGIYYSSPALSPDEGTLYVGTAGPANGLYAEGFSFIALDALTGEFQWSFPVDSLDVRSTPAVATDGSIYFVASSRAMGYGGVSPDWLYALTSTGDLQWRYQTKRMTYDVAVGNSSPAIGPDGTVYVAGDSLFAIRADGSLKWSVQLLSGEEMRNTPSVGPDGRVYFAFHNVPLTAFDPADGSIVWQYPLDINDHCFSSPAVLATGVRIANDQGYVYAVSSSGALDWAFYLPTDLGIPGHIRSSASVDEDGTVYIGSSLDANYARLLAIGPDGGLKWSFEPPDMPPGTQPTHTDIYSSPAIGADGTIFVGQEMGRVYALDPADGSMIWKFENMYGFVNSPTIAGDGTLYIADMNGTVFALRTDCGGLKTSAPWPKFRHDAGNTGSSAGG